MEHRYCAERHQCNIRILIYKYNQPVAFGRIINASFRGIFIETDYKDIQAMQYLRLEILSMNMSSEDINAINIDALVAHKTTEGFGSEIVIPVSTQAELFYEQLTAEPDYYLNLKCLPGR